MSAAGPSDERQSAGPLAGLKVLELGQLIAGPFAAKTLADFGADVIKVEAPGGGDPLRRWRLLKDGTSVWWQVQSRNKRSIALDLKEPEARDIVRRLAVDADVLIENFRPGAMESWGLGPEDLLQLNPRLVMLRISGYGQTGPYRDKPGLGLGIAVLHRHRHAISRLVAEDVASEQARLATAVAAMHGAIDDMLKANGIEGDHRDVLETYRMIAADDGWLRRIRDAIDTGLTAEAAVHKVNAEIHTRLGAVADPYLRERVHDLEDLAHRLMQHLTGGEDTAIALPADQDFVVIARHLGPAQLLDYHRPQLKGIVLAEGSAQAHVAIIARALGVPVIGQVQDALARIEDGDVVIVDADHAQLMIRPGEDLLRIYRRGVSDRARRQARFAQLADLEAVTRDGTRIALHINAGLLLDLQPLADRGIDGVGLYRTEVPFMVRTALPDVESQRQLYRQVFERAHGKPVVFRTLDVGGDKLLPYWRKTEEENPAMGWRAIRVSQDRPALLRQQLRALLRAAEGADLFVMFPMIAEVEELRFARRLLDAECARHRTAGRIAPSRIDVGAMLEVPTLLYQLDALLSAVDFVSIGTNDLFQFLFASDRSSFRMSERYDPLSPVFLELLRGVAARCSQAATPLSLCGEMAGRPLDAMALLGLGLRSLSVSPPSVGPIKAMIRSLDLGALAGFTAALCRREQASVREELRAFALDHGVVI